MGHGVVVYEMVTGHRPFAGGSVSDTLVKVLTEEPDWKPVPPEMQRLLRRCLEKDPARRMRNIANVELLLEGPPIPMAGKSVVATRWMTAAACLQPWPRFWLSFTSVKSQWQRICCDSS